MAYEIEYKVFLESKLDIINMLTNIGCIWGKKKRQYDQTYYKKEFTDANSEKEIFLRIRQEDNNNNILTLKQILNNMEVLEFESTIGNPDEIAKMIRLIGFEEYVTINKLRTEGKLNSFSICLDEVENLGEFLEVEMLVEDNCERETAKKEIQNFLLFIGINSEQICTKRYHTMLRELYNRR